jgi:hypothetical protein
MYLAEERCADLARFGVASYVLASEGLPVPQYFQGTLFDGRQWSLARQENNSS